MYSFDTGSTLRDKKKIKSIHSLVQREKKITRNMRNRWNIKILGTFVYKGSQRIVSLSRVSIQIRFLLSETRAPTRPP